MGVRYTKQAAKRNGRERVCETWAERNFDNFRAVPGRIHYATGENVI